MRIWLRPTATPLTTAAPAGYWVGPATREACQGCACSRIVLLQGLLGRHMCLRASHVRGTSSLCVCSPRASQCGQHAIIARLLQGPPGRQVLPPGGSAGTCAMPGTSQVAFGDASRVMRQPAGLVGRRPVRMHVSGLKVWCSSVGRHANARSGASM